MTKKILLNEEDFEKLTIGEVIEKDGVKIALEDIGFLQMFDIMDRNYEKFLNKK
jgi:hypothetical protein